MHHKSNTTNINVCIFDFAAPLWTTTSGVCVCVCSGGVVCGEGKLDFGFPHKEWKRGPFKWLHSIGVKALCTRTLNDQFHYTIIFPIIVMRTSYILKECFTNVDCYDILVVIYLWYSLMSFFTDFTCVNDWSKLWITLIYLLCDVDKLWHNLHDTMTYKIWTQYLDYLDRVGNLNKIPVYFKVCK